MKKIAIVIIIVFFGLGITKAQEGTTLGFKPSSYYTFSWNILFPMGDLSDWVDEAGLNSWDFGGRYFIKNGLAVGWNFGWGRIAAEYPSETYFRPDKGIAITATMYRFTWMVPFQAAVEYHFKPDKMFSPYIGLGIGGDYMEHHLMIQEYDIYQEQWDFSLTPEVGALVKFGNFSNWGAIASFGYKWTTNKIELYQKTSSSLSMLNLKIGVAYLIR